MNEILTEAFTVAFIVAVYLCTMMGIIMFLAFVCRVGDLGFMVLGWIDRRIQELPRYTPRTGRLPGDR